MSYQEAQSSVDKGITTSPTIAPSTLSSLGVGSDTLFSATPGTPNPCVVSKAEAQYYYAGLHSKPTLLYRTGNVPWSPPKGPEGQCSLKELCEVFTHKIVNVWHTDLGWKVVQVMDAHTVS